MIELLQKIIAAHGGPEGWKTFMAERANSGTTSGDKEGLLGNRPATISGGATEPTKEEASNGHAIVAKKKGTGLGPHDNGVGPAIYGRSKGSRPT